MITPRTAFLFVAALLFTSTAEAKPAKKSPPKKEKTWASLIDHVMAKGGEWPIKNPSAQSLGYSSDSVPAKSLGIDQEKSKDNQEHGIFVVYENDAKGVPHAKEVILHSERVTKKEAGEFVDGYKVRSTLDGKVLQGMHAEGIAGKVVQTPIKGDSAQLKSVFKSERDLYLRKLDWNELSVE